MYRPNTVLHNEEIRKLAPSVFAETAWADTSEHYRFIPTINVVNALRDNGYQVVMAGQSRSRIEGKREFTKHILRLRHNSVMNPENVGEEVPEIVLVNSHDRTSAYKLMLGIFRMVCANGMIVASETIESLNIRHSGSHDLINQVIDVSHRVVSEAPKALEQIHRFKEIALNPQEQLAFASSALELMPTTMKVEAPSLLRARRYADMGQSGNSTLWKTSNVIQENIMRGGVRGYGSNGRTRRTRGIQCIKKNVDINKALWRLTEELAKIKTN